MQVKRGLKGVQGGSVVVSGWETAVNASQEGDEGGSIVVSGWETAVIFYEQVFRLDINYLIGRMVGNDEVELKIL